MMSEKKILGDLPPNSCATRFTVGAAAVMSVGPSLRGLFSDAKPKSEESKLLEELGLKSEAAGRKKLLKELGLDG